MRLKIVDNGEMNYPKVVNAETGEAVEKILSITYQATVNGRTCVIEFISEAEIEMEFEAHQPQRGIDLSREDLT